MSCDFFVDGFPKGAPELNVANGNAGIVCALLNRRFDTYCLPCEDIQTTLVMMSALDIAELTRPTRETRTPYNCLVIECGASFDQVDRYRRRLIEILEYAKAHGKHVRWS